MDLKTLEYMEERAAKARKIVEKIEKLRANLAKLDREGTFDFTSKGYHIFDTSTGNLTEQMKAAYIQIAEEEIILLEQELAEI